MNKRIYAEPHNTKPTTKKREEFKQTENEHSENVNYGFNYQDYYDHIGRSCRICFAPHQSQLSQFSSTSSQLELTGSIKTFEKDETNETIHKLLEDQSQKINTNSPTDTSNNTLRTKKLPKIKMRKKRSFKRKNHALSEIRTYQKTGELLIPRKPFRRLCFEIARKQSNNENIRFQRNALEALQEGAEAYIIGMIEDSQLCCLHAKRITLMQKDIQLATKIRKD